MHHKIIIEHVYRAVRALLVIAATAIWLAPESPKDYVILTLVTTVGFTGIFKGWVENRIEDMIGWTRDFKDSD